jgi:hypothetical protein
MKEKMQLILHWGSKNKVTCSLVAAKKPGGDSSHQAFRVAFSIHGNLTWSLVVQWKHGITSKDQCN